MPKLHTLIIAIILVPYFTADPLNVALVQYGVEVRTRVYGFAQFSDQAITAPGISWRPEISDKAWEAVIRKYRTSMPKTFRSSHIGYPEPNQWDPRSSLLAYMKLLVDSASLIEADLGPIVYLAPFIGMDVILATARSTIPINIDPDTPFQGKNLMKLLFPAEDRIHNAISQNLYPSKALDAMRESSYQDLPEQDKSRILILKEFGRYARECGFREKQVIEILTYLFRSIIRQGDGVVFLSEGDLIYERLAIVTGLQSSRIRAQHLPSAQVHNLAWEGSRTLHLPSAFSLFVKRAS